MSWIDILMITVTLFMGCVLGAGAYRWIMAKQVEKYSFHCFNWEGVAYITHRLDRLGEKDKK